MIDVDTFYKIKELYHDGHLRVRIAEQLHLDAETVFEVDSAGQI